MLCQHGVSGSRKSFNLSLLALFIFIFIFLLCICYIVQAGLELASYVAQAVLKLTIPLPQPLGVVGMQACTTMMCLLTYNFRRKSNYFSS